VYRNSLSINMLSSRGRRLASPTCPHLETPDPTIIFGWNVPPPQPSRQRACNQMHRVVIVGGGFGGLHAAKALRRGAVHVTVLDRRNFHLFQPLLYQVATGGLSPGDITSPIRSVLRKQRNTNVILASVHDIDTARRIVISDAGSFSYDTLVLAAGAHHHYFGHEDWETVAPGLKTIEDATRIRSRILYSFEAAEKVADPLERQAWLTFVVVGAGPTGVELAGALGELANDTLRKDFRSINPADARIILVEGRDRVLPAYPQTLSAKATRSLERLGVTIRAATTVSQLTRQGIVVTEADHTEQIPTHCVIWAAGVMASSLAHVVASSTGAPRDRAGRLVVEPDLSLPGHPEILVVGDMNTFQHQTGSPLPGVAPVAMQEGRYAASLILARLRSETMPPFHYKDKGNLATIGRKAAVADFGRLRFSGFPAWALWLGIHLFFLIEFENRILVLVQWAWNYFTRNRGARLIAPPPTDLIDRAGLEPAINQDGEGGSRS